MNPDKKRIAALEPKSICLESLIEKLLNKIEVLTHRKNSRNSPVSSSKDENRALKSERLRLSQGKSVGGQLGHEGSTIEMTVAPDSIVEHTPAFGW
ncbi:hypothetical protein ESY86_04645 [Subsaximicrobium wynnwilliamsii]|uniref:Uncharacterized protein n=1 Tax=Subsaximicrobium wynnwilliamsii TaxID=291179 RepID=A0A5C6ZIL9_9FLAO|nr:DUF6444 domain-containing protein [Subsaximicrobium wynnwilliamsii]TXD84367.1 hypothetical protein ESY87_04425 [Subsaximicrobium wynnwilliamsii]TXD90048.1 hypothetical protein ESY86_04645 [Subsaximicrobium wynnwilliamsii]TXE04100.1 hypothetical protein ESY88_04420 [Subsaximicrobium wynnwilliamsii]